MKAFTPVLGITTHDLHKCETGLICPTVSTFVDQHMENVTRLIIDADKGNAYLFLFQIGGLGLWRTTYNNIIYSTVSPVLA